MPTAPTPPLYRQYRTPGIFRQRPVGSWIAVGFLVLALILCWSIFFGFIATTYAWGYHPPTVEADSGTYYELAGVLTGNLNTDDRPLVSFGGNLLGPVIVAKVLRDPFFVAVFDSLLLLLLIHLAGRVPGVRRRYFILLFFLNAESYVAAVSLNKEIFAAIGIVAFAAALYQPKQRMRYLFIAITFSVMARWEQVAIILMYLAAESRFSPFRQRHKRTLAFLLAALTITYPLVLNHFKVDVSGFLVKIGGSGMISRLDAIQAHYGLPLVIGPKILMNLFNRWLAPQYFTSPDFWGAGFSDLQNQVIIHLHCLAMLILFIAAVAKRRLSSKRPIPFLIYLYLLVTCVSPFVQPRYQFPVYVLLCLLCAQAPEDRRVDPSPVFLSRPGVDPA